MAHEFNIGRVLGAGQAEAAEGPRPLPEFGPEVQAATQEAFSKLELDTFRAARERGLLSPEQQRAIVERQQAAPLPDIDPFTQPPRDVLAEGGPGIPFVEPLEEATGGLLSRELFGAVGGILGTAAGIPAAPETLGLSVVAGGQLGAAGSSMVFDTLQDLLSETGLIEPSPRSTVEKLEAAAREAFIDFMFAGVGAGVRPILQSRQALSRFFGLNDPAVRQLLFKADLLGIKLGAVDLGGTLPKTYAATISVFPWSGGAGLRRGIKAKSRQAQRAINNILNTLAPNSTLAGALGIDTGRAARNVRQEFKRIADKLYTNFSGLASKASVKEIIPTVHLKKVAGDMATEADAGRIFLGVGGELPAVHGQRIKEWLKKVENIPQEITMAQYRRLSEEFKEIMGSASAAGADVRNAKIFKDALEYDLNNIRVDLLPPGEGEAIRRSLEVANNFYAKGLIEFQFPTRVPSLQKIVSAGEFPDVVVGGRRLTPAQSFEIAQSRLKDKDLLDKTFAVYDTRGGLGVEAVFTSSTQAREFIRANPNARFLDLRTLRRLEAQAPGGGGDLIPQQQQLENLRNTLESVGRKVRPPKVGTVRETVPTLPRGFAGQSTFETATAQRLERADRRIFKPGVGKPGALNEDELANVVINLRSARAVDDLEALVGTPQLRRAARKHVENAVESSKEQVAAGNDVFDIINPEKLMKNLGLKAVDKGEREALTALFKKGGVRLSDLEDLAEVVSKIQGVGDTAVFVKRRAILAGATGVVGAAAGIGGAVGGFEGAGGGAMIPVVAFALLARRGARIITSRRALRNITTALDQQLSQSARNQALGRVVRFITRGEEQDAIEAERAELQAAKDNAAPQDEFGVAGQARLSEPAPR
jgi:hypothetical protein